MPSHSPRMPFSSFQPQINIYLDCKTLTKDLLRFVCLSFIWDYSLHVCSPGRDWRMWRPIPSLQGVMVTRLGPGSRSSHSSESSLHEIYVDQAPPESWDGRETDSSLEVSSVIKSDTGRLLGKCFTPWQLVRPVHEHRGFSLGISRAGLWDIGWGPLLFCTSVSKCSLVSFGNSSWHGEAGMCLSHSFHCYLSVPSPYILPL